MEATSSTTTLQRTPLSTLGQSPHQSKDDHVHVFEEEVAGLPQVESPNWHRPRRWAQIQRRLESNWPRVTRFVDYVRGPRPKVELPEPTPWVAAFTFRGRKYGAPLEHRWIRLTHSLSGKPLLLLVLGAVYIVGLAFFSRTQSFLTPAESWISCTSAYWSANDGCGLDGDGCAPFTDSSFDFRCPAQCASITLHNPRTIGDEQVNFKPLIVGGGDANFTYRGDSFLCAAAVQAGLVSDSRGGCGTVNLIGNFTDFLPRTSHGLTSLAFPTTFPLSFRFSASSPFGHCSDLRNEALAFNVLITVALFLVLRPKPIILFWCMVCIGFWHITLFSQPRSFPPDIADGFGTFLPALFVCYAFWRLAFRFVLPVFAKMPIEATILYLGPYWVTVLANLTTERIPIDRLTAADIKVQSGGITALIIIVLVLFVLVVNQLRVIRETGWLPYYLGWLSALYQGFLLGLFLNGTAAFDFDSMFQTKAQLRRDGVFGTDLPSFVTNATTFNSSVPFSNQTVSWSPLPDGESWDGFALLVDDVERYVGTALNYSLAALQGGLPHFFRLAFTNGSVAGDFTKAATLWANGTWADPLPGPS
ncbi:hypothetical protein BC834DRAFT_859294 [Gloeopeniophorella convolvens]|nr:hypothetical protein BC834DRAFT_859294 [Gloeopeniophorella convolvens]